jgi:C-terminal processing protease CtpA/Prc
MKDIITAIDGKEIETSSDLIKALLNYSAGDTVNVTYERDGNKSSVEVKLASQADVYGEWNNSGSGQVDGSGGQTPQDPNGEIPTDPFGGGSPTDPFGDTNPFGDW